MYVPVLRILWFFLFELPFLFTTVIAPLRVALSSRSFRFLPAALAPFGVPFVFQSPSSSNQTLITLLLQILYTSILIQRI